MIGQWGPEIDRGPDPERGVGDAVPVAADAEPAEATPTAHLQNATDAGADSTSSDVHDPLSDPKDGLT